MRFWRGPKYRSVHRAVSTSRKPFWTKPLNLMKNKHELETQTSAIWRGVFQRVETVRKTTSWPPWSFSAAHRSSCSVLPYEVTKIGKLLHWLSCVILIKFTVSSGSYSDPSWTFLRPRNWLPFGTRTHEPAKNLHFFISPLYSGVRSLRYYYLSRRKWLRTKYRRWSGWISTRFKPSAVIGETKFKQCEC